MSCDPLLLIVVVCSPENSNIPLADSPKLPLPTPLRTAGLHLSPRPQNCSSSPVRRLPTVKRTLEADSGVEMDSGPGKMARNDTVSSPLHNHSASVHVPELPSPLRHVSQDVPPVPRSQWDVALNVAEAFVAALPTQTTTTPVPASLASEILPELCCPLCAGIMIDPVVAQCSHGFWYARGKCLLFLYWLLSVAFRLQLVLHHPEIAVEGYVPSV